jgi:PleD family two-component response regulator
MASSESMTNRDTWPVTARLQSVASAIRDELRDRVRVLAAERLAAAVGQPFTVSVGAACLERREGRTGTTSSLMRSADTALYEAKRQGGNRIHVGQLVVH